MVGPFKALLVSDVKTAHNTGLTLRPITYTLHRISFLSIFCVRDVDFSEISRSILLLVQCHSSLALLVTFA